MGLSFLFGIVVRVLVSEAVQSLIAGSVEVVSYYA